MKNKPVWWKEAVVYQIYPRSFQDSDGDGVGDLRGIISRLDYVKSLGVDVVWLNPIFASPNNDNGYDISDYRAIMTSCGTMSDFDDLLSEVHARGLKLVLDLVVNHTSDEHAWFVQARQSRENPYYDYYHWWPKENGKPPLRPSYFDASAWTFNRSTQSYYLHYFSRKQPDLNWENPKVRREIYDMMRFWLDKGIDGFRMDSIPLISKDISFPKIDRRKWPGIFPYYAHGPHLHDYLHEMNRKVLCRYDIMTVGEGSALSAKDVAAFVEPSRQELDMLYGFGPSEVRNYTQPDSPDTGIGYSLLALKRMFSEWDKAVGSGWPSIYLGNHDQSRMVSRFGSDLPEFREISARMLATFLLTMRGTPYWFAGDEIGMCNAGFDRIEDYDDIATRNQYRRIERRKGDTQAFLEEQKQVSRDNARTPFQWDAKPYADFTSGTPWLKVNVNYPEVNVTAEESRPDSVLNYFRRLTAFRKASPGLLYGDYKLLDKDNPQVYAYTREGEGQRFLVMLNFTPKSAVAELESDPAGAKTVLNNYGQEELELKSRQVLLRPFEAVVAELPAEKEK